MATARHKYGNTARQQRDIHVPRRAHHIKETAEGFKHRMRMRPTPEWDKSTKSLEPLASNVPGADPERYFDFYELQLQQVQGYIDAARRFVDELGARELAIKKARR